MAFSQNKTNALIPQRFYLLFFFLLKRYWPGRQVHGCKWAQKKQKCCQKLKKPEVSNSLQEAPILKRESCVESKAQGQKFTKIIGESKETQEMRIWKRKYSIGKAQHNKAYCKGAPEYIMFINSEPFCEGSCYINVRRGTLEQSICFCILHWLCKRSCNI